MTSSPSLNSTILVAYDSANSLLWVTIITNLFFDISLINSIIWILVFVSRAPVGSSARIRSGSFTKALAIATLCIWPPDNWFGFLFIWSCKPTFSRTERAFSLFSAFETPLRVKDISTFSRIVIWGIRL